MSRRCSNLQITLTVSAVVLLLAAGPSAAVQVNRFSGDADGN
jgi:hypothetical protein